MSINMNRTRLFYDSEFTGLTITTTLLSIGFITEAGDQTFYAELNDFDTTAYDNQFLQAHVFPQCRWIQTATAPFTQMRNDHSTAYGSKHQIRDALLQWFNNFDAIEIWADCHCYDWVLLCDLFGGALHMPKHIHYMPGDISTLFRIKGIDCDIARASFVGITNQTPAQHNALWDAKMARLCYQKLMEIS